MEEVTLHPFSRYVERVDLNSEKWRVKVHLDWPGTETRALVEGVVTGTRAEAEAELDRMIRDVIAELQTLLEKGQGK